MVNDDGLDMKSSEGMRLGLLVAALVELFMVDIQG